jgi:transposase
MPRQPPEDSKAAALREAGALHPRPQSVRDEAFGGTEEFFDPRDRVQVKYEMLRRHLVEGRAVSHVAAAFGISRQAFYMADRAFHEQGIPGLLPHPRGPRRNHKCTDEVLDFVERWRSEHGIQEQASLLEAVRRRFRATIHPRSLDRALARRKKKLTTTTGRGSA